MAMKYWNLPKQNRKTAELLAEECDISLFSAEILVNRGITTYLEAGEFLNGEIVFEDPFRLADMQKATDRIKQAVEQFEKIAIYGDYDCDGVTSTFILYSYLSLLGADVIYYIPKRDGEGYGLNSDAVQKLREQQVSLLITVDNGISALEEIAFANRIGMEVIVTDHHQPGVALPEAFAVLNPHRKDCPSQFKYLAGVGVVFKLIAALENGDYSYALEQFGDIVAVGTIGDIVSLTGENRSIVQYGLEMLRLTDNLGLRALMEVAGIDSEKVTSQNVAFGIAPRINAAGRMGDAALAVSLLLSETEEDAASLAGTLDQMNCQRKEQEEEILTDIQRQIEVHPESLFDRVLTFYHKGWHHGIIGIASSKVLETYGKPNLLMTLEEGGKLRGSARSVEFFSLYKALNSCEQYLERYGGHKQAAGFLLKETNFPAFKQALEDYAEQFFQIMPGFTYDVDKVILTGELSVENIKSLDSLEPFGAGNQQPLFLLQKAQLVEIMPVSENKHVRLKLRFGDMMISAIYFRMSTEQFLYQIGNQLDLLVNISINYYRNREYLSVVVRDIHLSAFEQKKFFNAKAYYEMFRRGEEIEPALIRRMTPDRDDAAVVYRYLKKAGGFDSDIDILFNVFLPGGMNYCKYRLILDILNDVGLIELSPLLDRILLCENGGKVDLETSATMQKLRRKTALSV